MVRVESGIFYFTFYGENEIEIGQLSEAEISEDYLTLNGYAFPLQSYPELKDEWDALYPNGKPVLEIVVSNTTSEEQKYKDMVDFLMNQFIQNEVIVVE